MKTLKKILNSIIDLFKRLFIPQKKITDVYAEEALLSPGKVIARRFIKNKLAIIGIIGFVFIFLFSFGLSLFIPLNLYYTNGFLTNLPPNYAYLNVPKELESAGIKQIDSGNAVSIGLSDAGDVFVWGPNYRGLKDVPDEVLQANIQYVSAGSQHLIAIDDNGNTFFWGYNNHQQAQIADRFVNSFVGDSIVKLIGGFERTIAITNSGALYVWGVGANITGDSMRFSPYIYKDEFDNPIKAVDAVSNFNNVLILLEDNTIRVIGIQSEVVNQMPVDIKNGTIKVAQIGLTLYNGFVVDVDGNLHIWGSSSAKLHGTYIPDGAKSNIKKLVVGYEHATVLTNDGEVFSWGDNALNQTNVPQNMENIQDIFVNGYHNYAVDEEDNVHAWGNKGFLFGSDESGRDFIIQVIHGGKITLTVGAVAVIISVIIGVTVGLCAGFFGGKTDNILMRFTEIVASFPFLPFAITLSAVLVGGATSQVQRMIIIMFILGVLSWTGLARLIRGQILSERERDYVLAARSLGIKRKHIIIRHIFPAVISIVIVNMTLGYAGSLLTEAGLSFLGFGVQKPDPSWGNILTAAQEVNVIRSYWWRWIIPGIAIIIAALSVNLIGDALRDAMDPKNAER